MLRVLLANNKPSMPMKQFTLQDATPSELTLHIIREIAHSYRVDSGNHGNSKHTYGLN